MPKDIVLITLHGMGDTKEDYSAGFKDRLERSMPADQWKRVRFESFYYQHLLQENQKKIMLNVLEMVRWTQLRQFVLFALSDATSLESRPYKSTSPYAETQAALAQLLGKVHDEERPDIPVVIVAESLGCQVTSNYLWDATPRGNASGTTASVGHWLSVPYNPAQPIQPRENFQRLRTLKRFITLGCNIPVFAAGHPSIQPIEPPNRDFRWVNLYYKNDVLGWPMTKLYDQPKFEIEDVVLAAPSSFWGVLTKSWNPFVHTEHWNSTTVIRRVVKELSALL